MHQWGATRAYIPKEEAALPTISTESTFITAAIAASKRRKVRCYDIPSAFVNTDVDEDVLMVLKGELAEMMVQIAPQVYPKYVTVNSYDPCVANMSTECGKQLMVIWHVDDLMSSCKNDFELTKFLCYLGKIYGPKLSMHTGWKHDYLGVDMEFKEDGTLDVSMVAYLKNVISDFPELITGKTVTAAADHLFTRDRKS